MDAAVELRRVTDRLSGLSLERLDRPGRDGISPAGRARVALQTLADRAADGEGIPRRRVPVLGAHALTDQLQVLARDALEATGPSGSDDIAVVLAGLRRAI